MCDTAWFELYLESNPKDRKRRDLVVRHATARGGDTEAFLRYLFPRYWGMVEEADGPSLSPERETEILAEMVRVVAPSLSSSREHATGRQRQMPDHVPHIR